MYFYLSSTKKKLTDFDHYSERTPDVLVQREEETWHDQQEDKGKDVHTCKDKKETKALNNTHNKKGFIYCFENYR